MFNKPSFLHTLFLENKAQINKVVFHVKTSLSGKNELDPAKKWRLAQKAIYTLFAGKPSIIIAIILWELFLLLFKDPPCVVFK